jgi:probable HAF family extracellular repeat protein
MHTTIRYATGFLKALLPVALLGAIANSPALAYELIDLGANVEPRAINNNGVVVGSSNTDQYPATAFSWSSAGGFDLIKGGTSANAVNDDGLIAGSTIDGAFIGTRQWSDYGAFGINQSGEVAGYNVGKNPYQPRSLPLNPAIFNGNKWEVFDIAKLYPRGTRQGVYADRFILNSINDAGITVGYKYRYGLAGSAAILIDTNGPVNDASDVVYLSTPYGGSAVAINNSNMVTGTTGSNSSTGEYAHAFLYDYNANTVIDLGTLPVNDTESGLSSAAYDINDLNQVVGSSRLITANTSLNDPAKYHAFIWEDGQMSDLNSMVQELPAGWILNRATAINENGDIAGVGLFAGIDGVMQEHGFLLTNGTIAAPPPVENPLPVVAAASADPVSGKAPLMVNFDSSGSTGANLEYSWDFMDGTSSTAANPSHEFTLADSYPVTLIVTDNQGTVATSVVTITVRKGRSK